METDFAHFERRIDAVYRRCPGEGRAQVVLTRLCVHATKVLELALNRRLAESGLNTSTWLGLMTVYSSPERAVHPSSISELAFSSRTQATRVVEDLERRGWLSREPSTSDRRRVELRLTAAGVAAVERLLPVQRRKLVEIWSGLDAAEQAELERLLRKLLGSVAGAPDPGAAR